MAPRTEEQFEEIREKSKAKIVMAALELFSTEGYLSTTISGIAQKAGVSKGLLYNYFDGKESILMSIIEQMMADGEQIMQIDEDVPPKQHFKNILDRFFAYSSENIAFYRMIFPIAFQISKFSFIKELMEKQRDRYLGDMIRIFEQLGYDEPEMEAWNLAAMTDGMMIHLIHMEDEFPLKEMEQFLYKKYKLL